MKNVNMDEFITDMIKFYKACDVSADDINIILTTNHAQIKHCLAATPELMARKFYQWTFNKSIN